MQHENGAATRGAVLYCGLGLVVALGVVATSLAASSQNAPSGQVAGPTQSPENAPATQTAPYGSSPPTRQGGQAPNFSTPPVAIVPLDKSIPGAALSVAGPIQAWNGRAYLTSNGTVTAGGETAQVALPYRGTLHVCASSSVNLAADSSAQAGQIPGLLIALDRGAVEMSFAASSAREHTADTLLTPYFRIMIGGPSAADVKVRLGQQGDTCVDNAGNDAPYVVVSSVFDGGIYRVMPGQRVMFEHGSLHEVVDQEKEPCGCPASPKAEPNAFPLAQSEGFTLPPNPPATTIKQPAANDQAATTLVYNGGAQATQSVTIPQPAPLSPPAAPVSQPPQTPTANKKQGLFKKIGRFFRRIFGAE